MRQKLRLASLILWGGCLLVVLGCENKVRFSPQAPETAEINMSRLASYSSEREVGKEVLGTLFQTSIHWNLHKEGDGFRLERRLDSMTAKGFHRNSLPDELEKRADLTVLLGPDWIPTQVSGYDSLPQILSRLDHQKEDWKKELLKSLDTAKFTQDMRDRWRLATLLPRDQDLIYPENLPVKEVNAKLESIQADSIRFFGPRLRLNRECLDYTVYYTRHDSLPLQVEQFIGTARENRRFWRESWGKSIIHGSWQFSVDRETGLTCFDAKNEDAEVVFTNEETKAETPVRLMRYEENIFQF